MGSQNMTSTTYNNFHFNVKLIKSMERLLKNKGFIFLFTTIFCSILNIAFISQNFKINSFKYEELSLSYEVNELVVSEEIQIQDNLEPISIGQIDIYAFKNIKEIETLDFEKLFKDFEDKLKINEDRISTALAAAEKSIDNEYSQSAGVVNSKNEVTEVKEEFQVEVVDTLLESLEKKSSLENSTHASVNLGSQNFIDNSKEAKTLLKVSSKNLPKTKVNTQNQKEDKSETYFPSLASNKTSCKLEHKKKTYKTSLEINPKIVALNYGHLKKEEIQSEIKFKDSPYSSEFSNQENKLYIKEDINGEMNIRRGTVYTRSTVPTTSDFVIELEDVKINLPLITIESYQKLIESKGLRDSGANILIELDNTTEDVFISSTTYYQKKLYLNNNFKEINPGDAEYNYVFFVGVDAGNTILTYKNFSNEQTSKIIHLSEDEIYYDSNVYVEELKDSFTICEESLLSKEAKEVSVAERKINSFSFDSEIKIKSMNSVAVDRSLYPLGTRKYFSIKDENEEIFLGRFREETIIIPDISYRDVVLRHFGLRTLGEQCVVQVNINKGLKEVLIEGQGKRGYSSIEKQYLDRDGNFYKEISDSTTKLFLLGEEQGLINIKLNYKDNTSESLMTYCSENTYLIEQI